MFSFLDLAEQELTDGALDADVGKVTGVVRVLGRELDLIKDFTRVGDHHRFALDDTGDDVRESALVHLIGISRNVIGGVDKERRLLPRRQQFVGLFHEIRALLESL